MKNEEFIVKKILPYVLFVSCIYIWIAIILCTMQLFGNGILAYCVGIIMITLNIYVHINTWIYKSEEYDNKN